MDASHFNHLLRSLTSTRSRRQTLTALLSGRLGLLTIRATEAKKRKAKKRRKKKHAARPLPAGGPCPGQKLCQGACIPTNQCCTDADCPAVGGYRCCIGLRLCTNTLLELGSPCANHADCCSGHCDPYEDRCSAECRGQECTSTLECCPGFPCQAIEPGFATCGGCGISQIFCESDANCCYSACTNSPNNGLKKCLSYAGGPCKTNEDCRSCVVGANCAVMRNGVFGDVCFNGVCGCPYECCAAADCSPQDTCVSNGDGLHGECRPIISPP